MVAHPPSTSTTTRNARTLFLCSIMSSLLHIRRNRGRHHLHPAAGALFNIGVVALRIPAVIPIGLLLRFRCGLDIYLGLLLDNDRRRRIIRIVRCPPPPWAPAAPSPSRADPDTSAPVASVTSAMIRAPAVIAASATVAASAVILT